MLRSCLEFYASFVLYKENVFTLCGCLVGCLFLHFLRICNHWVLAFGSCTQCLVDCWKYSLCREGYICIFHERWNFPAVHIVFINWTTLWFSTFGNYNMQAFYRYWEATECTKQWQSSYIYFCIVHFEFMVHTQSVDGGIHCSAKPVWTWCIDMIVWCLDILICTSSQLN